LARPRRHDPAAAQEKGRSPRAAAGSRARSAPLSGGARGQDGIHLLGGQRLVAAADGGWEARPNPDHVGYTA